MIDNQVHIGHNCIIDDLCILAGKVGLSGSVNLKKKVTLAGDVSIKDNVTIGENSIVAGASKVFNTFPENSVIGGNPAQNLSDWKKIIASQKLNLKKESLRLMIIKDKNGDVKCLHHRDILNLIPHRYPFLLIDKVTDIELNKSITGIKAVTFNEPFFDGHFPQYPVMPGVLILESMAQTAACLVAYEDNQLSQDKLVFFTGIEKAKFKRPVTPGCILKLKIKFLTNKRSLYKFSGEAYVDNNLVATSEFSAMLVDQDKAK